MNTPCQPRDTGLKLLHERLLICSAPANSTLEALLSQLDKMEAPKKPSQKQ